jgi:NAD(P)-dependent dehydrogenase (short-subunit alcohol dehydrogenase family)
MLKNKVAVIYGCSGAVGSAIAGAFAREGARVFLTGRNLSKVDTVAKSIMDAGGRAEAAQVDALDERAVDGHLQSVIDLAGRVDVSFNAIGIPNTILQGVPLVDLDVDQFLLPIATYARSYFLTSRLAARRMVVNGSGVIMTITAVPSRMGIPLVGGFAPAQAAVEALTRGLSAEFAPHGVRVVGLRADGMPETGTIKEVFGLHARAHGISWEHFHEMIASKNHRRRLLTLAELANVAVFMASDQASAMTGSVVNLSMGMLDD